MQTFLKTLMAHKRRKYVLEELNVQSLVMYIDTLEYTLLRTEVSSVRNIDFPNKSRPCPRKVFEFDKTGEVTLSGRS